MLFIACVKVVVKTYIFLCHQQFDNVHKKHNEKSLSLRCFCVWRLIDFLSARPSSKSGNSTAFPSPKGRAIMRMITDVFVVAVLVIAVVLVHHQFVSTANRLIKKTE